MKKANAKPSPKPSVKASVKPSPSKSKKDINIMDEIVKAGVGKLSPSQKKRIADILGLQYPPKRPKLPPSKPYNPKDWEGTVGDKGW